MAGPSPANAFSLFNRDVSKAKKFIKAGMYPQAIAVLEKRINEEPDDAEADFLLGRCYIHTGNLRGADARFESAVRLDADYGFKIGGKYKKPGSDALAKGNVDRALRLFRKAVGYQPGLKKEIAKKCFSAGVAALDRIPPEDGERPPSGCLVRRVTMIRRQKMPSRKSPMKNSRAC